MAHDGSQLEALVAFVEKTLLPQGFNVKTNQRVFNDEGIQVAEFDVEIRGRLGSTDIAWLIECRDRPSEGPAPGAWIEQLFGRRARFGFNKVTAVSTTGFAAGAIDFARRENIELREVQVLSPDAFADWLVIRHIVNRVRHTSLLHASLLIAPTETEETRKALAETLEAFNTDSPILRSSSTGQLVPLRNAFHGAIESQENLFEDLEVNGPPRTVRVLADYVNDADHFVVQTRVSQVRIRAIQYRGELRLKELLIPLIGTTEYRDAITGGSISQAAVFAPQSIMGMKFTTEMHKMAETGETHVILRRLPDDA